MEEQDGVKILRKNPTKAWRAAYAVREESGRTRLEEERINVFALCEDEEGNRFVSGLRENGELCVLRDDFVGYFSLKTPLHKVREAFGRFSRAKEEQERSDPPR